MKTPFGGHLVSLWMMPFNNVMQYSTILNFNCFLKKLVVSIKKYPIVIMFDLTKVPFWKNQFGIGHFD
jgi:hypothetical protein